MSVQRVLQWVCGLTLTMLLVMGCGGTQAETAITQIPSTATPTPTSVPPSATPTSASTLTPTLTPTATPTPTPVLLSATPTPTPLPTPTPTATPTLAPTWSGGFQLGAVVDDISAHSELMLTCGIMWVKQSVRHSAQGPGNEAPIELAHSNGLRILLTVTGDKQQIYDGEYQATFISFLASLAEQGADAIEVWNEPNLDREVVIVDPAQYTTLLCTAYTAIKEANPDTLVISGAPAPTGYFGGCTSTGCDDLPWVQGLAAAGAAECLDFIGASYTAGATSPSAESGHPMGIHHTYYFWPMVERYHAAFANARPLAFTTFGYLSPEGYGEAPEWVSWGKNTTVAKQAAWTTEAVQISIDSGKVGMIIIWNLDSTRWGGEHNEIQAGWALIRHDGSCPACEALQELLLQQ